MNERIGTWLKSLGDFPLDPERGRAWLWTFDGRSLIWISDAARADLDPERPLASLFDAEETTDVAGRAEADDGAPVKVETLMLGRGDTLEPVVCLTRQQRLRSGEWAWLAVAIGSPARSLAEMAEAATQTTTEEEGAGEPEPATQSHEPDQALEADAPACIRAPDGSAPQDTRPDARGGSPSRSGSRLRRATGNRLGRYRPRRLGAVPGRSRPCACRATRHRPGPPTIGHC